MFELGIGDDAEDDAARNCDSDEGRRAVAIHNKSSKRHYSSDTVAQNSTPRRRRRGHTCTCYRQCFHI